MVPHKGRVFKSLTSLTVSERFCPNRNYKAVQCSKNLLLALSRSGGRGGGGGLHHSRAFSEQQSCSPRGKLHTVLISLQVFYSKKHVLCASSWVSKSKSMVKTSEYTSWFNLWTRMKRVQCQHMTIWRTQPSPIAPILEAVMSCAVRSSQKHGRLYHCGCWLFRRMSCVAWTGHKSSFFSCSYVKKNCGYRLRLPRKCHVPSPAHRADRQLSFSTNQCLQVACQGHHSTRVPCSVSGYLPRCPRSAQNREGRAETHKPLSLGLFGNDMHSY